MTPISSDQRIARTPRVALLADTAFIGDRPIAVHPASTDLRVMPEPIIMTS